MPSPGFTPSVLKFRCIKPRVNCGGKYCGPISSLPDTEVPEGGFDKVTGSTKRGGELGPVSSKPECDA